MAANLGKYPDKDSEKKKKKKTISDTKFTA